MIREGIEAVVEGRNLTEAEAIAVMREIMEGSASPAQIAAVIFGLRMKGETVEEITGCARVMRDNATFTVSELRGGDAACNADLTLRLLHGEALPQRGIVLLNAAAAIAAGTTDKSIVDC